MASGFTSARAARSQSWPRSRRRQAVRRGGDMFSKILVCSDGSEHALKAAEAAAAIAARFASKIVLVTVFDPTTVLGGGICVPEAGIMPVDVGAIAEEVKCAIVEQTGKKLTEAGAAFTVR